MAESSKSPVLLAVIPWIFVALVCGVLPAPLKLRAGKDGLPPAAGEEWMQGDSAAAAPATVLPRELLACGSTAASPRLWKPSWVRLPVSGERVLPETPRPDGCGRGRAPPLA